jgi:hypothetical protein
MDQEAMRVGAPVTKVHKSRRAEYLVAATGVLLVPAIVMLAANSWAAPEVGDYIRMAFAQVAAAVIGCATLAALTVAAYISERRSAAWGWFGAFALAALFAMSSISNSAGWLERAVS